MKNHTTGHAVMHLLEEITSALDDEFSIDIFIDLAKAFNTIDHRQLLGKPDMYGISGTVYSWVKLFLENCQRRVHLWSFWI